MAGKAHPDKEKVTYGEWKSVRKEVLEAAGEEGISEPEMLRKITLAFANKNRKKKRKKPLAVEYKSGNGGGLRRNEPPPLRWDRRKKDYVPVTKKPKAVKA